MSGKYSASPALRLIVGNSRIRRRLHAALSLCVLLSVCLVCARGYALLAATLVVPCSLLLWRLRSDTMCGVVVCWKAGAWSVERDGRRRPVRISPRSIALPWVIYLAWRELTPGAGGDLWLFTDSAPPWQLRGLRVRLSLEG